MTGAGDSSDASDAELLRAARSGDREALERLVLRHLDWLRSHVRRKLRADLRREFSSEDMLHDVVIGFLKGEVLQKANDLEHFRALLATAVQHDLVDRQRWVGRERRDRAREVGESAVEDGAQGRPLHSVTRPSQHAMRDERKAWIRLALGRMDPADREVLELRIWEELPHSEIAARLGLGEDAARMRVQRALARLARAVRDLKGA